MTTDELIDQNVDKILKASGSSLKNFTMESTRLILRCTMREIMYESYIRGSNEMAEILEELRP